jgi:hypothetical protein
MSQQLLMAEGAALPAHLRRRSLQPSFADYHAPSLWGAEAHKCLRSLVYWWRQ